MTSKEAYLKIQEFINDIQLGITRSSLDIVEPLNVIRELTKEQSNPTFEQCIKEWENKNAQIKINHKHLLTIYIPHKDIDKYIIVINFWKTSKQYDTHIYDTEEKNVYPADISFEIHDLIHKTVKALEVENDNNR